MLQSSSMNSRAGTSAALLLLKLDTPAASASTPAPTTFLATLMMVVDILAPWGFSAANATTVWRSGCAAASLGREARWERPLPVSSALAVSANTSSNAYERMGDR